MKSVHQEFATQIPTHDEIAARAFGIYQQRGGQPGHEIDDWLQAEYELMQLPIRKIAELEPPQPHRNISPRKSLIAFVHTAMLAGHSL